MARSAIPSPAEARAALVGELRRDTRIIAAILVVLWTILIVNTLFFGGALNRFGIVPRTAAGLRGVIGAPLLHGGVAHLFGNSIGIVLLGGMVLLREESDFWIVTALGVLLGGLGTWFIGRPNIHIGASGVIFAYFGYLVSTGVFERQLGAILWSVAAALFWGGMVFGILPGQPGISWEGHLFGLGAGVVAARLIASRRRLRSVGSREHT